MASSYEVLIAPSGQRALKKLPIQIRQVLHDEVKKLATDPYLGKRLEGEFNFLSSLKVIEGGTHYRVIYQVKEDEKLVIIRFAAPRENVYRRLLQLKAQPF